MYIYIYIYTYIYYNILTDINPLRVKMFPDPKSKTIIQKPIVRHEKPLYELLVQDSPGRKEGGREGRRTELNGEG